jgi:hypothetical protein
MSRELSERTTVVVASVDAEATVLSSLAGFLDETKPNDEVILVDASRDGTVPIVERAYPEIRILRHPRGRLVPELWAAGLRVASTPYVAFSTAQMRPRRGWLTALFERLAATRSAGAGGSIAPGRGITLSDRALYLLRYAQYLPPVPTSARFEPPGDNALYVRNRLASVEKVWREAFWEVEVHRALRARGEALTCAPDAEVEFLGGTDFGSAVAHRLAHARNYGFGRVRGRAWGHRLARSVAFPMVPPLLLSRILRSLRSRGEPLEPWLPALPRLMVLLSVWSLGEAQGACFGPPLRRLDAA